MISTDNPACAIPQRRLVLFTLTLGIATVVVTFLWNSLHKTDWIGQLLGWNGVLAVGMVNLLFVALVVIYSTVRRDPLIVRSTIDLAHALEMEVTAEGVETPSALALLSVMGCDMVQGFLISRPLGFDAFRNHCLAQAMGQADGRVADDRTIGVVTDLADEGAVELEVIDREHVQVTQ